MSDNALNASIADYTTRNNITGNVTSIRDTYYGTVAVKQVDIDCRKASDPVGFPCFMTLFINENGTVVEALRTT